MKDVIDLIGRILISIIFLYEAYDTLFYYQETKAIMASYGVNWNQDFLLVSSIMCLILGGLLLLLGYRPGLGSILILFYWIPVTFIAHSFWNDPPENQRIEAILFMKNLAIIGGLMLVYVNGSGRFSIRRLFATTKVK